MAISPASIVRKRIDVTGMLVLVVLLPKVGGHLSINPPMRTVDKPRSNKMTFIEIELAPGEKSILIPFSRLLVFFNDDWEEP